MKYFQNHLETYIVDSPRPLSCEEFSELEKSILDHSDYKIDTILANRKIRTYSYLISNSYKK